jgi:hypothetical protein
MSFLKQLLTPFVAFDEDKKKEKKSPITSAPTVREGPAIPVPNEKVEHPLITGNSITTNTADQIPSFSAGGTLAGPVPEHEQYFEKLIDEANARNPLFAGADFKEFVDSKIDIDDITDEAVKYQTAFNILKNNGLTKEKLISTGQEYLNIVGRDLNAFQGAHAQLYKKELGQKDDLVKKKAEELQLLLQRVNVLKSEINQLTLDINLTKDKLNTIRNSFLLAGEKKQKEIQTELQKIAQYFQMNLK